MVQEFFSQIFLKIAICDPLRDFVDNFHENLRKRIDLFFKTFLINRGKNEDENEKKLKN